ncbi:MAG TPA: citrate/2-methylcitrate synthase [Rubrivivax sp.]|nr:citrate/2-methylcitrate synthase [Rubrivivax sp.]
MDARHDDQLQYVSAGEAARLLGVKTQTLYSYASRGMLRSKPEPGTTRSLYERRDVERLATKRKGREPAPPSSKGDHERPTEILPALTSAVTQIAPTGPRYRGHDFKELVRHPGQFENVAELLWSGMLLEEPLTWEPDVVPQNLEATLKALHGADAYVPLLRLLSAVCLVLGVSATDELRSGSTARLARRLVTTFARCASALHKRGGPLYKPAAGESIARIVLRSMGHEASTEAVAAINAVLIACADHELSPATYAVRIVASTGAGLHACLSGGLSAHSGHRLGGRVDRLEDLITGSASPKDLRAKLATGSKAFGSASFLPYDSSDPRGHFLMTIARDIAPKGRLQHLQELISRTEAEAAEHPTLEIGLIGVARALDLPRRAPGMLWVLGRSAGWVAHTIEQRLTANVIRPRARFVSA